MPSAEIAAVFACQPAAASAVPVTIALFAAFALAAGRSSLPWRTARYSLSAGPGCFSTVGSGPAFSAGCFCHSATAVIAAVRVSF